MSISIPQLPKGTRDFYPEAQRIQNYIFDTWRQVAESFAYEDSEPSPMQRFFLTHKEINVAEMARLIGINPTLLRNYINGFKKPSPEREKEILTYIHKLGREMMAASF